MKLDGDFSVQDQDLFQVQIEKENIMIVPFLDLKGHAAEAIDFYETVFHGQEKKILKMSDMPENPAYPIPEEQKDWVAHAQLLICGTMLHFCDTEGGGEDSGMISLLIHFDHPEEVKEVYQKLKEGGEGLMEPEPSHFSKMYGWVKDQYGVNWQLLCE